MDARGAGALNLAQINKPPGPGHPLGTDPAGRDVLGQLLVGARNSFLLALGISLASCLIGTLLGLLAGLAGGAVDAALMRLTDFFSMLPVIMVVIVLVALLPRVTGPTLVAVLALMGWYNTARYTRARVLQISAGEYVAAARAMGTPFGRIITFHLLPGIAPLVITGSTIGLASSMGAETGLSFLGFGLPIDTPSLGTLLGYAKTPENLLHRPWLWLPACLLVLVLMLCINALGRTAARAFNPEA